MNNSQASVPQWLSRGDNPVRYMELVDEPTSEGHQIREQVIFPTLSLLLKQTLAQTNAPVVDFGSGTGSLTSRLSRYLKTGVEGVDSSHNFITLSNRAHPETPVYLTKGRAPVGYSLHNTNAHLVLHCTPEPEKLLENMVDVTEPDGYICVTIPHPSYFKASQVHAHPDRQAYVVKLGEKVHMTYYHLTIGAYEEMFRSAGLKIIKKQACFAPANAPDYLSKYKKHPYFMVYVLQKKVDEVDTALIMHSGSGKLLLLTRSLSDDKFPGAKSLFSVRRKRQTTQGPDNLAKGLRHRLGIQPEYISPHPLGSLLAKHRHQSKVQHANVNLYAVKVTGDLPAIKNKYYDHSQLITPSALRPSGGACTQLGYHFIRSHLV